MTQLGESAHQAPEPPQESPPQNSKNPVEIRISVFFDGTGNNRGNIQARQRNTDIYQKIRSQNDDAGDYASFEADFSNIALLEEQYESTTECQIHKAFYIEGVATREYKSVAERYADQARQRAERNARRAPRHRHKPEVKVETDSAIWGNAAAVGATGIYAKIDRAYNEIMFWFTDLISSQTTSIDPRNDEITKFVVDVFGFSRGAATARHFIHFILTGLRTIVTPVPAFQILAPGRLATYTQQKKTLREGLMANNVSVKADAIQIGFVGLFDTVSSYVIALTSDVNILHLDAVKNARKVYHLAAADEHRLCFSLTNIKSAKNSGIGEEYFLPGAHSDIGGGYRDLADEVENFDLMNDDKTAIAIYATTNRLGIVLDYREFIAKIDREGWYKANDTNRWFRPSDSPAEKGQMWLERDGIIFTDVALKVYRDDVTNLYRRIPLQLMAEAMEKEQFNFKPQLRQRYNVPSQLNAMDSRIRSYIGSVGNGSKPEDWFKVLDGQLKPLRHKHLHYSSRIATGHWPRFKGQLRYRQYYDG